MKKQYEQLCLSVNEITDDVLNNGSFEGEDDNFGEASVSGTPATPISVDLSEIFNI